MPGKNRLVKRKQNYSAIVTFLSGYSKTYKDTLRHMRTLNDKINECSELSAEEFDRKKKEELIACYKNVMKYVEKAIDKELNKTEPDQSIFGKFYIIRKILSKDFRVLLTSLNQDKQTTLNDIFEESRTTTVKLDKKLETIESFAGNQNERYRLSIKNDDNNDIAGYFTKDKTALLSTEEAGFIIDCQEKTEDKYHLDMMEVEEQFSRIANRLLEVPLIFGMLCTEDDYCDCVMNGRKRTTKEMKEACTFDGNTDKTAVKIIEGLEKFSNMRFRALLDYMHMIAKPMMERNNKMGLGINTSSFGNRRNSAMSAVAGMIGCPNVVAHSENLKLQIEEKSDNPENEPVTKTIKGTFMEEIKGEDVQRYDETGALYKANLSCIEECDGLVKNMADLQILDYLCGNPDRHYANVIYKIENGKLVSITGIDNDTCFGSKDHTKAMAGVDPDKLMVISRDTANKILTLDEESFKYMLYGYNIDSQEAKNAVDRLNKLKEKIINDEKAYENAVEGYLIPGKLKVCDDQELNSLSIHSLLASKKTDENGIEVMDNKNLFSYLTNTFITGKGPRNVINNYKKKVSRDVTGLCTQDAADIYDDLTDFYNSKVTDYISKKTLINEWTKNGPLSKEEINQKWTDIKKRFLNIVGEVKAASDILRSEMSFIKAVEDKESGNYYAEATSGFKDLKTHVGKGLEQIKTFLEEYPTAVKGNEEKEVLDNIEKHLRNAKDRIERIEQNVEKINAVVKDSVGINNKNKKINDELMIKAAQKKEEVRRMQLRNNMNAYLEPLEEEVAFSRYEISELQKKYDSEADNERKTQLENSLTEKKLEHNLNRLSLDAAYGLIKIMTEPDKYKEDDTFRRGLAAGLIRYKIEQMKNSKGKAADAEKTAKLDGIPTDIHDYDQCIETLMNNKKFRKTASSLSPAAFSEEDVKKLAKGDLKGCFEKVANSFAVPLKEAVQK